MLSENDLLQNVRNVARLYRSYTHSAAKEFTLSDTEVDVLAFLHAHPQLNTATDITEISLMTKSNVSQAVDRLITLGLLTRSRDTKDRRKVHLHPTERAAPILDAIFKARQHFANQLVSGFTQKEKELYANFNARIAKNAHDALSMD